MNIEVKSCLLMAATASLLIVSQASFARAVESDTSRSTSLSPAASADAAHRLKVADALLDADNIDDAIGAYDDITRTFPDYSAGHEHLADAFAQKNLIDDAIREDRVAIESDPLNTSAHQHLGLMYGIQGRYEKAVFESNAALNFDSNNEQAYVVLGSALTALKNYEPALAALEKAIAIDPRDFQAYLVLGATMGRKGDYAGSVQVYKKALRLKPNSIPILIGLGADYDKLRDVNSELKVLRRAVAIAPTSAIAHGHLGSALWRSGDYREALSEGAIATTIRLNAGALTQLLLGWGLVFVTFGAILGLTFAGSRFKPQDGETYLKSFFLIFYRDKPGRFVITSRRIVFVPELISSLFHSTRLSIERDNIELIESLRTASGASLIVHTVDGGAMVFKLPVLVLQPLLRELESEKIGVNKNSFVNQFENAPKEQNGALAEPLKSA